MDRKTEKRSTNVSRDQANRGAPTCRADRGTQVFQVIHVAADESGDPYGRAQLYQLDLQPLLRVKPRVISYEHSKKGQSIGSVTYSGLLSRSFILRRRDRCYHCKQDGGEQSQKPFANHTAIPPK